MPPRDEFLESFSRVPPPSRLRLSILEETTHVVRQRRRRRRSLQAALVAASLILAVGLARWLAFPAPQPEPPHNPGPLAHEKKSEPIQAPSTALAQEWQAFDAEQDRSVQYLHAGHRYLQENYDPESALRCYRQALDAGEDASTEISVNDDWLLMALKLARQKEKNDATLVP